MKSLHIKLIFVLGLLMLASSFACKKWLDKAPPNSLDSTDLANKEGVDGLLIGAYSLLDGTWAGQAGSTWATGTDNWIYGSVAADDAHKGSTPGDQPDAAAIESYTTTATNGYLDPKWVMNFGAIQRTNDVLRELPLVKDGSISTAYALEVTAECRFLRGFYYSELSKLWRNVPYIDETVNYANGNYSVGNPGPIWDKIEADLTFAMTNLPVTQPQVGRANKYAAEAFLAKAYMYEHKYAQAKPLLEDLIANGVNSNGVKYALGSYGDNFNPSTKNGAEGVFVIQTSVHDGSNGANGNSGDILNFSSGGPANCCGFFQPSFSFVNAFKTDANGLPLLDTYNDSDLKNDQNLTSDQPFTPTTANIDSRLDWSVGRRGIPYLDWGIMPGQAWCRDQADGGPYAPIKSVYYKAAQATTSDTFAGWAANQSTANSYNAIRFADILLWAAEIEVEIGSLQKAEDYVNRVRARAALPANWVKTYKDPANSTGGFTNTPAAHYVVGLYGAAGSNPTSGFAAGGQAYARKAVQFERRLEFGQEGHRFFDLQRWDGLYGGPMPKGFMADAVNSYLAHEIAVPNFPALLLKSAHFTAGKNELYPIPQNQIDYTHGSIKQNPNY
jgi:hypothetical protein